MSDDCVFCKIVKGEIPSEKVYETDLVLCIRDINPQAKTHVLVVPKKHFSTLEDAAVDGNEDLLAELMKAVPEVARRDGVNKSGFRTIINNGRGGGQTFFHLHIHVLGGQSLGEKLI